ncbi:proteoglycan 4b isoform X2 [Parambassis ranga]|uniref:Proteoglycan 4b isoform X2 n=1 Tax=Parambassis ranga TaxID=210632 RepID=A0A6P7HYN7_9TELE|nr:proteoglycan 4-like isoform X2 [Parambassis ranga]
MSSLMFCALILLACALNFTAAQTSCKGRCGSEYYRGYMCQCDYNCLSYEECCNDFEAQCTTKNSCKGRCGESFKRGRLCSCDPDCVKYKQCCSDYKQHCDAGEATFDEATPQPSTFTEGNDADDPLTLDSPTSYPPDDLSNDVYGQIFPSDEFSNTDAEATQIPESSSGYGATTADLLDQSSTEPTLSTDTVELTTETVFSQTDMMPSADYNLHTLNPTNAESPSGSTASDTTVFTSSSDPTTAEPTTPAVAQDTSSQPASTSAPETGPSTSNPELETLGMPDEPGATILPLDKPEVTNPTISASATPDPTPIQEETTSSSNTESGSGGDVPTAAPSSPADAEDPFTTVTPVDSSKIEAATTLFPPSTATVKDETTNSVTPTPTQSAQTPEVTSKPQEKPHKPPAAKPTSKPENKPQNTDEGRDYQGDDSNDPNLCSGRPVSGVTTLRNGTTVVFRGHYFWFLDRNRVPSPARGITQVWGIPSPIDTVFTRCNCQGKTYIFKGGQYWRFENDVLDPGYPKVVETGFDGLRGHITAALSVPQYQRRRESVYFFKRGGHVQKYSYQYGTSPTCGRKVQHGIYTVRNRMARQAVSLLEPAINIRTAWRGFPSTITAAVSIPSNREPEGYKYYVFSRSKSYNVRIDGERPVITTPTANAAPQANNFFNCPKKV